jgi:hypothetical protein
MIFFGSFCISGISKIVFLQDKEIFLDKYKINNKINFLGKVSTHFLPNVMKDLYKMHADFCRLQDCANNAIILQ